MPAGAHLFLSIQGVTYLAARKLITFHYCYTAKTMDPISQFTGWYAAWKKTSPAEPAAMILSTADSHGNVSSRVVLLKELSGEGFVFYTNYRSRKASQLVQNERAALLFWWQPLGRQVRIEGRVKRADGEMSEAYFKTRPRESRIGAWASEQSSVIPGREYLEERVAFYTEKFRDREIETPPFWGGFILVPDRFEFWEEGDHRLHFRTLYRYEDGAWITETLAP